MKLPAPPPEPNAVIGGLLSSTDGRARFASLLAAGIGPSPGGRYKHWETFRYALPLEGFSAEEQWFAVKFARQAIARPLPLRDRDGRPFTYALPNVVLEMLHHIDRDASGNIVGSEQVTDDATRDTYLFKSVVEEAITSSQLEGASTTRKVAKAMIQEGRAPRDRGERMIRNNYDGMLYVRGFVKEPLTPEIVVELQRRLTEGTLDIADGSGRLRRADEEIVIEDEEGTRLHTPPHAGELGARLQAMCDFANGIGETEYLPPPVRAIVLHFWLAYDHPFVDGNGRTARALFYWCMARHGYWLCEFVSISRILKRARAQYARAYLYTETDANDVTYFLVYQLRVLRRAIEELHTYLARKARELREAEVLLSRAAAAVGDINPRQLALIRHAMKQPLARYTIESHRRSHGVTYQTARTDLLALVKQGLLEQRKAGRAFTFHPAVTLHERLSRVADAATRRVRPA
jgi:Fic family protein